MTVTRSGVHVLAAVAVVLLAVGAGCSATVPQAEEPAAQRSEPVRHELQEGRAVESSFEYDVRNGEEFSFDLAAREGIDAMRWMVEYDRNMFEFVRDEFRPSSNGSEEGRHFFIFRARSAGGGRIVFSYGDPKARGAIKERVKYVVRVDP